MTMCMVLYVMTSGVCLMLKSPAETLDSQMQVYLPISYIKVYEPHACSSNCHKEDINEKSP